MYCLQTQSAPVDVTLFIVYTAFSLISVLGVVFTENTLYSEINILSNVNDTDIKDDVQIATAKWTTIFLVCQALPAVFVTLYVSTVSDYVGRKITMVLPTFGYLIAAMNYIIVYVFKAPIEYLLFGNLAIGFTGTTFLLRSGAASYVSDLLPRDRLTLRMSILLGVTFTGIAMGQLGFSLWVDYSGFLPSFIFLIATLILCLLYILCIMKESVNLINSNQFRFENVISDIISVVTSNKNNRRCLLLLLLLSRVSVSIMLNGIYHALQLYCIGPPLYMSTSKSGYFTFGYCMSNAFGMLVLPKVLKKYFNTSDYTLFHIGILSVITSSLVIAITTSSTIIYLSLPLSVLIGLPKSVVEAQLSKIVEKHEKGAIFAQAGVLDNLGFLLGPIWVGITYAATVETIPSFIFYIMVVGSLVNMLLVIYMQMKFGPVEDYAVSSDSENLITDEETPLITSSSNLYYD